MPNARRSAARVPGVLAQPGLLSGWPGTDALVVSAGNALTEPLPEPPVISIVRASMSDFKNVDLTGAQKSMAPYYVTVKIKALGAVPPKSDDDPAITFDAIDNRGQGQESVTFIGTFQPCNDNTPPQPFTDGKSYTSCLVYPMPGGGSIQRVQWADGPSGSAGVTPWFDKPIVWG